jgi:hypothetical protein
MEVLPTKDREENMLTNVENYQDYEKISQSELYLLNRCKKAHEYSYYQGLVPGSTPDYLTKGSFFHLMQAQIIENQVSGVDDIGALSRKIQAEQAAEGPTVDESTRLQVVEQLVDFWDDVGSVPTDSLIAVEEEFYVDLGWRVNDEPVLLHGFIDAVVRDDGGDAWVVEHKTAGRAWSQSQFEFAYQGKLYAEAWEVLTGERPLGIQYNFFYPKRWEIRQQYVTPQESALLLGEIQSSLTLRALTREHGVFPREPKWGCGDCRFRNLCFTELVGGDSQYIRDTEFTVDEERIRWQS